MKIPLIWMILFVQAVVMTGCHHPRPVEPPKPLPADIITTQVHVIRARNPMHGIVLIAPLLTVESGKQTTYDIGGIRLMLQPTSNGDNTVTIRAVLYEHADTRTPDIIACPDTTIVDGETATNQIGVYSFKFTPRIKHRQP